MRIRAMFLLVVVALVLSGCDGVALKRDYRHYDGSADSYGDDGDDNSVPRLSEDPNAIGTVFNVPLPYQQAYRRADAYARACRTNKRFSLSRPSRTVRSNLFDDDRQGFVHISSQPLGPDLERIDVRAVGASAAAVEVRVRNSPTWDRLELDDARQSIETGRFVCRDAAR